MYVCLSHERGAELGRFVERGVFLEVFGNTQEQLAHEYDQYEPGSIFITVVDHARRLPCGMMRVLVPSSAGFKSLDDVLVGWESRSPSCSAASTTSGTSTACGTSRRSRCRPSTEVQQRSGS